MPKKYIILIILTLLAACLCALWLIDVYNLGAKYRMGALFLTGLAIFGTAKGFWLAMPYTREEILLVRFETPKDVDRIRTVHLTTFPTAIEANLVEALRSSQNIVFSIVMQCGETVVGHCAFSRMATPRKTLELGPVAVMPEFREFGIADQMIQEGIEQAIQGGWTAVFTLENPEYYQRFSFSVEAAEKFSSPYSGPNFMALPLNTTNFEGLSGQARHPSAFDGYIPS